MTSKRDPLPSGGGSFVRQPGGKLMTADAAAKAAEEATEKVTEKAAAKPVKPTVKEG